MKELRRRRWIVGVGAALLVVALLLVGGHTGQHVARSLIVPGAGLYGERPLAGAGLTVAAVLSTIAWLRWGTDWILAAVVVVSVALTALLGDAHEGPSASLAQVRAAHEFPLVVLVLAALGWLRSTVRRVPGAGRLRRRRSPSLDGPTDVAGLAPVDRCRAASILALAGPWPADAAGRVVLAIDADDVRARCRRVGLIARLRRGGDPFRVDHAHARAALAQWGRLDTDALARFAADAERGWTGSVPSEPGWVRLLDGTLASIALREAAPDAVRRWRAMLEGPMRLGRRHRPAWVWTPLGLAAGRPDDWEHAAATALARAQGWVGDDDWEVLRPRALGAAARGTGIPADERLIAAGRVWTVLAGDDAAARLLARPTLRHDPLAAALDAYATHLRHHPIPPPHR